MNLSSIKRLISEPASDIYELDLILSVEYLMSRHRSAFLDQRIYDLNSSQFTLLRKYMAKAIDLKESDGDIVNYFCIPITAPSTPSKHGKSIIEQVSSSAILNIATQSGLFSVDAKLSELVIPKSTLFGSNIYSLFDFPRLLLRNESNFQIESSQLMVESSNQHVFYLLGCSTGDFLKINPEDWHEKMHFIESRFSKCIEMPITIMPPVKLSDEMYDSLFRDLWLRLVSSVNYVKIASITLSEMVIDHGSGSSTLVFYEDSKVLISIGMGSIRELNKRVIIEHFQKFVVEHNLGDNKIISIISKSTDSKNNINIESKNRLKIIK